jgi:hypothetical protein
MPESGGAGWPLRLLWIGDLQPQMHLGRRQPTLRLDRHLGVTRQ